jgi:hypothetical protein
LIVIVLPGAFVKSPGTEDVVPDDASNGIGEVEELTLGV